MGNRVKYGLCDVHISKITVNNDGTFNYGTPFAIPGAVSLTLDAEGDEANFSADNNAKYFTTYANNGYSGSLEMAIYTEKFRTDILGETTDTNGALVENKDDTISDFALGFQIDGDSANRRFWLYSVSAARPSTSSQTIENSKEPVTDTLNITATARLTDGAVKVFMEKSQSNAAAYEGFFTAVYEAQ